MKTPSPQAPDNTDPVEILRAFWRDFAECEESSLWDESGYDWDDYYAAIQAIVERYCTERICSKLSCCGREQPSRFSARYEETIVKTKITKSKAFIYTLRANSSVKKHCWVLQRVDDAWKIDRRKREGMQLDKYREIPIC